MSIRKNKHRLKGQGMHRPQYEQGVCRICKCTDETPCIDSDGIPCAWTDDLHTLCTACQ